MGTKDTNKRKEIEHTEIISFASALLTSLKAFGHWLYRENRAIISSRKKNSRRAGTRAHFKGPSRISPIVFLSFLLFSIAFSTGSNQHSVSPLYAKMNENRPNLSDASLLEPNELKALEPTAAASASSNKDAIQSKAQIERTPKRQGYLSWDDYFLAVAYLSSKRSKDPKSGTGACIVDQQNRIVGIGYSGFPRGCSDSVFPWNNDTSSEWLHTKDPYLCQSVMNAILNKCTHDVAGARIYVMEYPDSESAKVIIQSGIGEVVVLGNDLVVDLDDVERKAAGRLFQLAQVKMRFYQPNVSELCLDFASKMDQNSVGQKATTEDKSHVSSEQKPGESEKQRVARAVLLEEANYDASKIEDNGRSKTFISWQDYFMAMAFLTAQRSKDPNTQVGACIVDDENRIIGLGYNGFPSGCSDDILPWARSNSDGLQNKYLYVCHAEVNAILNKGSANVKGATVYVALFPCQNCAKMIIQSGIKEVVYMNDAYHDTPACRASRVMFRCAGVKLRQYIPSMRKLFLNLEKIQNQ